MKNSQLGIFRRLSVLVFVLITVLSILFIAITYLSTTHFYKASTQLLNKDVAAHVAKFTSPFEENGINKAKADSVFHNAMVLNPSIEVYFLDTTGKVLYYKSPDTAISLWNIPLQPIHKYISSAGTEYVTAPDPKNPSQQKVFSAAEVHNNSRKLGYIYVVLGGKEYGDVASMLFKSHVGGLALKAFIIVIVLSLLISIIYFNRLQKNYRNIITVLEQFQGGDFNARFTTGARNEFAPITASFNKMADLLSNNMNKVYKTEKERRDFIANISHDLRTPLSVARGYTETLLSRIDYHDPGRKQEAEYAQLVHKKIEQVEKMVQQLFELSKMESLESTPSREPFLFSELLEELVKSYQIVAAEKNIHLTCTGCQDSHWINADIRMMERVIQNLMDNAIKYTPAHGIINVALQQSKDEVIAEFENSGPPLPEQLIRWINNYGDGHENAIRPEGNSGLGLAIVKKILELHHYSFKAEPVTDGVKLFFRMAIHKIAS